MENKNVKINTKTLDIVQISLMAAIIYIATAIVNVPVGIGYKGVVHLGDSMIFVAAILLGKRKATIASAIGMSMFDILSPYAMWAPFTFFIKGGMAYIAYIIAYRKDYKGESTLNNLFAFIVSGVWMNLAYLLAGTALNHFYMKIPLNQSFIVQSTHIPGDIAQVVVGIIIALPLIKIIKKTNINFQK
ncbi:thiamine precursor transporter HmpT [Clostridium acetireducens DSM 10703]|jgi:uncharacterized membrane protein|uniref:Thiamine transporter HmpT n=1 Tax=Clostridium acetireducens DSM 10703 TaxID=1121290 RepID=A0A1E8F1C5_9CLOT|nr:ECF transporter S component [Clostridium acetireducens]OFI07435.1 thiamine precursor transporter HmpT [Clostridium acetireducens DSM 10703]